jgi:hypothetical protein
MKNFDVSLAGLKDVEADLLKLTAHDAERVTHFINHLPQKELLKENPFILR